MISKDNSTESLRIRFVPREQLRRRTGKKWSTHPSDVLPAWVAEMDVAPMPAIAETIRDALVTGDLGYPPLAHCSGVPEAFCAWAADRWNWRVAPNWIHFVPDVVAGIENCIEALTEPGDAILVYTPVYPPFLSAVADAKRRLVPEALIAGDIDFESLEERLTTTHAKMVLLCNPHNPVGRVFTREELRHLADLAIRHGVLIVSDEIHGDLAYPGYQYVPFASVGADAARMAITLTSATKTFNIAGLRLGLCVAADQRIRERLLALPVSRRSAYGILGVRATLAAWSAAGQAWHAALMHHLANMRALTGSLIRECLPEVLYRPPEAGYLAWLDCRAIKLAEEPAEFFLRKARVALSLGCDFGPGGEGHTRLNFATSESVVREIIERMAGAVAEFGRPACVPANPL